MVFECDKRIVVSTFYSLSKLYTIPQSQIPKQPTNQCFYTRADLSSDEGSKSTLLRSTYHYSKYHT